MKKFLIHVGLILTFIVIYLIQTIFFTHFTIAGIMPNVFIILMLYIGLYMGRTMGVIYGIIYGIFIVHNVCRFLVLFFSHKLRPKPVISDDQGLS